MPLLSSRRPTATPTSRRTTAVAADSPANSAPLPTYQAPSAPLNTAGLAALDQLPAKPPSLAGLKTAQASAIEQLSEAVTGANDRTSGHRRALEKKRARLTAWQQQGEDGDEGVGEELRARVGDAEEQSASVDERVLELTRRLEERVRAVIDGKEMVRNREAALEEVSGNVVRGEGRVAPTQSTLGASQFRQGNPKRRSEVGQELDEDDEDGDEGEDEGERNGVVGLLGALRSKVAQEDERYAKLSLRARYAENNDYVGFKKVLHDAMHQDDGVPLAHSSTWFPADPDASIIADVAATQDEDSDLEVAAERISTRCPITLMELQDAVTTACGHNFERAAILDMISRGAERVGGTQQRQGRRTVVVGGERAIRCPESSCRGIVAESALKRDPLVRRKIQRLQAAKGAGDDDEDGMDADDGTSRRRAEMVHSDDIEDVDDEIEKTRRSIVPRIKREVASSRAGTAVPGTQLGARLSSTQTTIIDMEGDDEDDDEDEEWSYGLFNRNG